MFAQDLPPRSRPDATGRIQSAALGTAREFTVRLPEGYAAAPQRRYPTIYVLDGPPLDGHTADAARALAREGAGPGVIVVGIPTLLAGLGSPPEPGVRRSEPRMVVGAALTDYGMALVGGSIGLMVADKTAWLGRFTGPVAASFLASGIGAVVVGIPLWASGQSKTGPLSPAAREIPPPLPPGAGTGMRSAGVTLTLLGVTCIGACIDTGCGAASCA